MKSVILVFVLNILVLSLTACGSVPNAEQAEVTAREVPVTLFSTGVEWSVSSKDHVFTLRQENVLSISILNANCGKMDLNFLGGKKGLLAEVFTGSCEGEHIAFFSFPSNSSAGAAYVSKSVPYKVTFTTSAGDSFSGTFDGKTWDYTITGK